MNKQITLIQAVLSIAAAATLIAFGNAAQAAPARSDEGIIKLPRVVVTSKMEYLPRVVVTAKAAPAQFAKMEYLPRVVVVGPSPATRLAMQQQQLMLLASAAAPVQTATPTAVKLSARAL